MVKHTHLCRFAAGVIIDMRFARGFVVFPFIYLLFCVCAVAQNTAPERKARILILLDGSSSMVDKWQGTKTRFNAAENVIMALMDSVYKVNPNVEFGLRVFGHQHSVVEKNCFDTKKEVFFNRNNTVQMSLRLASIKPYGITPIAYSIRKAVEEDMVDDVHYAYSLILITDGGESCGGDICEVVREMLEKKIYFKPYIISLFNSAELAMTYACMGQYMQVTNQGDIPKAVHAIVDAYKPMLKMTIGDMQPLAGRRETPVAVPKPMEIPKPVEKPKPIEAPKPVVVPKPVEVPKPIEKPVIKPPRAKEILAPVYATSLTQVKHSSYKLLAYPMVEIPRIKWPDLIVRTDMPRVATVGKPRRLPLLFTIPTYKELDIPRIAWKEIKEEPAPAPKPVPVPKPVETPKPVAKETPKPKPAVNGTVKPSELPKPKPKPEPPKIVDVVAKVETEEAEETTVEVYFTNGKGRFYSSTPQILFKDVKTNEVVHKFYRMVNIYDKPDPQKVPPGKYNVMIAGRSAGMAKNITITPNKKNKVIITINNGSLHFEYEGNKGRPVSEYQARVAQRSGNTDVTQQCDIDRPYDPGSYHITVNTKPLSHFYVDLEMNATTVLALPEPGFVQFTNTNRLNTVSLYAPQGDRFIRFMGFDILGQVADQKLDLKPGKYEVKFIPNAKTGQEITIPFVVKSNQVTELELK